MVMADGKGRKDRGTELVSGDGFVLFRVSLEDHDLAVFGWDVNVTIG